MENSKINNFDNNCNNFNNYNFSNKQINNIIDLPIEILEIIFNKLEKTDYQSYINASLVCRKWRKIIHRNMDVILVKEHTRVLFHEDLIDASTDEDIINFSGLLVSTHTWFKACKLNKFKYRFNKLNEYLYPNYQDYMYENSNLKYTDNLKCKGLALFPNLCYVVINFNQAITDLDFLKYCPLIEHLNVSNNDNLKNINAISGLYKLKELLLDGCKIKNLHILKNLKNIEKLSISECDILESLEGLENNKKLIELDCNECVKLKKFNALKELHNLNILILSSCEIYLNTLPILGSYDKVTNLDISFCSNLNNLNGLNKYKNLKYLNIENCNLINDFNPIKLLFNIEKINIECEGATNEIIMNMQMHFNDNNINCITITV